MGHIGFEFGQPAILQKNASGKSAFAPHGDGVESKERASLPSDRATRRIP